ncbi:MAG: lytic transglycosylase domain-containing protein [Burkholderiales bacterium]|jgi:soluble lytic murein transglycosylase|nr:lytic transglycosylase domain-containing protein [Burkholderiales bacterium]MBP6250186.1 lytic transglycosylase domain-containing protein [Leptothrix sp. (in: b-proteobacteria)]MBP7519800.1 lytic transglycosylase domain-containing protein [Leptothrix sp. (in: b-proteobacteria)]
MTLSPVPRHPLGPAHPLHRLLRRTRCRAVLRLSLLAFTGGLNLGGALAQAPAAATEAARTLDSRMLDAQDAARKRDRARLLDHRNALVAARHPLASWAEYWELGNRLGEARQDELDAFYARWGGSYVEDRLRNDWLLELGRRRDWRNFALEYPRFKMNDDREVSCYQLLLRHQAGDDVRSSARSTWLAQRSVDDGCHLLATTLVESKRLSGADVWLKARAAAETGRLSLLKQTLSLLADPPADRTVQQIYDQPQRWLQHAPARQPELLVLALVRLATSDPVAASTALQERAGGLAADTAAWAWAAIAKQAAWKLMPEAEGWFQRAFSTPPGTTGKPRDIDWGEETLAWRVRAALRSAPDPSRWTRILEAIGLMSATQQADTTWVYWKARALQASAATGSEGEAQRMAARVLWERIAPQLNFYGQLAAEELGRRQDLPARPAPPSAVERLQAEQHAGLSRALTLIALGLRNEGVREWNFSLRDLNDRELLAAAQRACDREVWDRCINSSDRTRQEVDLAQRFPTPFRQEVVAMAQEVGVEAAFVYGLIRQESRFITDARSSVGASGLMQVMPATAKWTAKRLGMTFTQDMITDRSTNLRIGMAYLKLLMDDFGGSQALATAAYNAGPSRSRRWREGPTLEVAAWAESIPFNETRDYVKKVLSNASIYAALMGGQPQVSLRPRVTPPIAPREPSAAPENRELP